MIRIVLLLLLAAPSAWAVSCPPGLVELSGQCVRTPSRPPSYSPPQPHRYHRAPAAVSAAPPVSEAMSAAPVSGTLRPVRAYLSTAEIPPAGVGAYGLFALHAKPTEPEMERFTMACRSFIAYLTPQSDLPSSVPLSDQMLTIWPLENPTAPEAATDQCDYLLAHYDLFAADEAMRDATRQGATFKGEGPFLIGWSPSDTRGVPGKLVMVYDMSGYRTPDRFNYAFQFWKDKIVNRPELFRRGWDMESLRLSIRDFANQYGTEILKAAHLTDGSAEN